LKPSNSPENKSSPDRGKYCIIDAGMGVKLEEGRKEQGKREMAENSRQSSVGSWQ